MKCLNYACQEAGEFGARACTIFPAHPALNRLKFLPSGLGAPELPQFNSRSLAYHTACLRYFDYEPRRALMMTNPTPRILDLDRYFETPESACVAMRISRPTLYKRVKAGVLRTVKIGPTRLIEKPAA
jgi:excisionase family DNA binding protein